MDISHLFQVMIERDASDMFLSVGAPVAIKVEGAMQPATDSPLGPGSVKNVAYSLMNSDQIREFEETLEMNFGLSLTDVGRIRVNVYRQRGDVAMAVRYVKAQIPTIDELNLPGMLKDLIMEPRGLILVVGATGSGKTSTLAAMIDHRNSSSADHILTIEDPIEYVHTHKRSIVDQREVGIDTLSYENALTNAMREVPDVILIGEIREHKTMQHALAFSDTGHLCLSTLHANNADQTMDRVVNFFSKEVHNQLLMDLSLNLRAVIGQRMVTGKDGKRLPAVEILLNTPYITELIQAGKLDEIKAVMEGGKDAYMRSFDQALFRLYREGKITKEEAIANADSRNDLNLKFRFSGDDVWG